MRPENILRQNLFISGNELDRYLSSCPRRYKHYKIEKRGGEKDNRRSISQPTPELKALQRTLLDEFLVERLPVHQAAMAYKKNTSIADNAKIHARNSYLLKMDFENFFPSIKSSDLCALLIDSGNVNKDDHLDLRIISRVFFMHNGPELVLSIGAPSSPFISNAMLFNFDKIVAEHCGNLHISYSRYSDDLTFSTTVKDILFDIPAFIQKTLKSIKYPKLAINEKKTVFSSKAHNRHVTGVTLSNTGEISLGRSKKRSLRTQVYLFSKDQLSLKEAAALRGYIAFSNSVEPKFLESLLKKYPKAMRALVPATLYSDD
ncbi:retron St85 family RNA-directed DNA polymerase [Paracoccus sediminilitoris]|uniref:retron St85 family RNA-directed DNA polymerase n=1 Tax=Paracoccus sediminilitoris TaxID=2202419 RepID=UPI00272A9D9B|nr:retron St85 family RNA-directed DNA polymerase [Paracoccus sediminilitoris]